MSKIPHADAQADLGADRTSQGLRGRDGHVRTRAVMGDRVVWTSSHQFTSRVPLRGISLGLGTLVVCSQQGVGWGL